MLSTCSANHPVSQPSRQDELKHQMIRESLIKMIDTVVVPVVKEAIGVIYTPQADEALRSFSMDELEKVFILLPLDSQFIGWLTCSHSLEAIKLYCTNLAKELLFEKKVCPVDTRGLVSQKTNEDRLKKTYEDVIAKTIRTLRQQPASATLYSIRIDAYSDKQLYTLVKKGYNAILTYLFKTSVDGSYYAVISSGVHIYKVYDVPKASGKNSKKSRDAKKKKQKLLAIEPSDQETMIKNLQDVYTEDDVRYVLLFNNVKTGEVTDLSASPDVLPSTDVSIAKSLLSEIRS